MQWRLLNQKCRSLTRVVTMVVSMIACHTILTEGVPISSCLLQQGESCSIEVGCIMRIVKMRTTVRKQTMGAARIGKIRQGEKNGSGRPLGYLAAWLELAANHTLHYHHFNNCFPANEERDVARARLYEAVGSEPLFVQEYMYEEFGPHFEPDEFE